MHPQMLNTSDKKYKLHLVEFGMFILYLNQHNGEQTGMLIKINGYFIISIPLLIGVFLFGNREIDFIK